MTSWRRTDSRHSKKWPGILTGLSGLFVLAALLWPVDSIGLSVAGQTCSLPDSGFALQWQHSVEKEDWREDYRRSGSKLLLTRSRFKTYGAGTPSDGNLHGGSSGLVDYQVNRLLNELDWVVSGNVQSTLWINQQAWPVHAWFDDYTVLGFRVRRTPFGQILLMDSCHDLFRQGHNPG